MALTAISLTVTVIFVLIVPAVGVDGGAFKVAALMLYFILFIGGLDAYSVAVSNLRSAIFEYQTLRAFVDRLSDVADVPGAIDLKLNKNPTIEFSHVSFTYGGKQILDDITFKVEGGQTIGLVGSSGCGKSTVLRLLLRFYRPTNGTIIVDGHDISKVTAKSLRALFSVVTQDAALFNASIRENIVYGRMGSSDSAIIKAASLAELSIGAEGDDLTLDKNCGEKGAKLSGGQQQRVAIARAMLKNGTIYLLDEPTTGLDGVVAKQLQKTLDELSTNATTICITHHLEDLKNAHQVLYLDQGKVVEQGTFQSLIDAQGEFFKQVGARK